MQGALRKELHMALFVEPFKTTTSESLTNKFTQNLEQLTKPLHLCRILAEGTLGTGCCRKGTVHFLFRRAL